MIAVLVPVLILVAMLLLAGRRTRPPATWAAARRALAGFVRLDDEPEPEPLTQPRRRG